MLNDATEAVTVAQDPHDAGGPPSPAGGDDKVSVSWLILQRLEDLRQEIGVVKAEQAALRAEVRAEIQALRDDMDRRFAAVDQRLAAMEQRFAAFEQRFGTLEQRWTWALGLVLVMALGLLAKLLIPGA